MLAFSPAGTVGDNVMKITSNTRRISINGVTLMSARGSILRRFFFIVSPNSECSRDSDRQDFVPEKLLHWCRRASLRSSDAGITDDTSSSCQLRRKDNVPDDQRIPRPICDNGPMGRKHSGYDQRDLVCLGVFEKINLCLKRQRVQTGLFYSGPLLVFVLKGYGWCDSDQVAFDFFSKPVVLHDQIQQQFPRGIFDCQVHFFLYGRLKNNIYFGRFFH